MVQEAPHRLSRWPLPALLVLASLAIGCKNDLDQVAAIELPQAGPSRVTLGAEYYFTDAGRIRNRLRAGRIAEWTEEPKRTELSEGLELVFYDSTGAGSSVLTARRGLIEPAKERMEVFEEVVFVNARGERLETEQLTWEQDSARVRTDRPVRVVRGNTIIHGHGLDADEDFGRYTIRQITGVLHQDPSDTLAPDAKTE
jgi:LPS export ABC transporter protein LptC